jgi:hypothetical protein
MKRLVGKVVAVFCLVSIGICSKGNFISKEIFPSVERVHGLLSIMKNIDSLARPIHEYSAKIFLPDWKKAPNSYILIPFKAVKDCLYL